MPRTAEVIADQFGVGKNTVIRAEKFAGAVDALAGEGITPFFPIEHSGKFAGRFTLSRSFQKRHHIARRILSFAPQGAVIGAVDRARENSFFSGVV